ncbi:MAG: hypothetical protein GY731_01875 [Gammaproteobacteria bacterium]|nr:hypothetical protein [Gammaproteobacteria bacterium]
MPKEKSNMRLIHLEGEYRYRPGGRRVAPPAMGKISARAGHSIEFSLRKSAQYNAIRTCPTTLSRFMVLQVTTNERGLMVQPSSKCKPVPPARVNANMPIANTSKNIPSRTISKIFIFTHQ